MIKTLREAERGEKERFSIPRSVQQSIPIKRIYRDGIWQVGGGKFSRTWRFADINYAAASQEDRRDIFMSYSEVLNSLPTDASAKITISNRHMNPEDFQNKILLKEKRDRLDLYRKELNQMIRAKVGNGNNLVQDKYITISTIRKNIEEARTFYSRVDSDLSGGFGRLESGARPLTNHDRLRILHDFFRPGEEAFFTFDLTQSIRRGMDVRDLVCPDSMRFRADHFELSGKVGRVIFLKVYPSYLKDSMIAELCDLPRNMMLSIDVLPIPTDEAVKEVQNRILGVETDITRWQQRANAKNNFSATIPYELEQVRNESKEFLDDLVTRDQRMIFATVTIVHLADSLEQLDTDTETLLSIGRKHLCQYNVLRYQQEKGLNTVLPYGLWKIRALRTLTTESTAVLMPFRAQEIQDPGGMFFGINAISKNPLVCDRKRLISPHAFALGVSGSGKSVGMKGMITNIALASDTDEIIIIDAEREYGELVKALGGEVIEVSPNSPHHIDLMAMEDGYGEGDNPITAKSEALMSVLEQQMGEGKIEGAHRSIIDRCTGNVYRSYLRGDRNAKTPLLTDWRNEVMRQSEPEAQELALASEIIIEGSLNIFAHPTNVDLSNRIIVLDLYEMGEALRPTGLNVCLETIKNRVTRNRRRGVYTWVFIDEVYLFFKYQYSAQFLYRAWKRFRKYAAPMTAATQNVEECLRSETARLMFANSEFLLLYNQAATDRAELAKLLHISDTQLSYITNAPAGHGLLRMSGSIVPFVNEIPRDSELYKLMSTTPGDK